MRAVLPHAEAPDFAPRLGELPDPEPGRGEVVIAVQATAVNHADLLQMRGRYPPPPGESEVPGLECAGVIDALGEGVEEAGEWRTGRRVMALLAGGGHGTQVAAPVGQLMPIPEEMSLTDAAALPEAALTSWTNLVVEGGLREGEGKTVLLTGATGGMGTFGVQLARELGARVLAAGRDRSRLEPLRELGAEALVEVGDGFVGQVKELTGGRGVDLVLDLVGGAHLARSMKALAPRGRLVLLGLLAGAMAEIDLADVLRRRLELRGSVLRARSREEKAELVAGFRAFADERLADGRLKPVVDRVLPFDDIAGAYRALREGGVWGKVVVAQSVADSGSGTSMS